jgi:hypothetical protein
MAYILSTQAYAIIMLHGAKYPSEAVSGVLLGSKQERKITRAVPLVHSILLPSPPVQIALEQIEVYAKQKKLEIVGLYFGNQVNVDVLIHPATELIANKIEENVGGGSVIVRVFLIDEINPASITSDRLGLVYYCYENKIWKETMAIK